MVAFSVLQRHPQPRYRSNVCCICGACLPSHTTPHWEMNVLWTKPSSSLGCRPTPPASCSPPATAGQRDRGTAPLRSIARRRARYLLLRMVRLCFGGQSKRRQRPYRNDCRGAADAGGARTKGMPERLFKEASDASCSACSACSNDFWNHLVYGAASKDCP